MLTAVKYIGAGLACSELIGACLVIMPLKDKREKGFNPRTPAFKGRSQY